MKNIAITGGRGRLAPPLAEHLRACGYGVEMFSRTPGEGIRHVAELQDPAQLADFDALLHLGWSSVPLVAEQNPGVEESEDYPLTRGIVAAAQGLAAPPLLVFFSTAAVYGNTGDASADEETSCRPLGRYAAAKLRAESIISEAPRACVLRITNIFSPGCQSRRAQGIIPIMLDSCLRGTPLTLWGDGSATKDYLAASDLHVAVERILGNGCTGVFNVASGHTLSLNELITLVERATKKVVQVVRAAHYAWDVEQTRVSSAKLQRATGWIPLVDPDTAIGAMAAAMTK